MDQSFGCITVDRMTLDSPCHVMDTEGPHDSHTYVHKIDLPSKASVFHQASEGNLLVLKKKRTKT